MEGEFDEDRWEQGDCPPYRRPAEEQWKWTLEQALRFK